MGTNCHVYLPPPPNRVDRFCDLLGDVRWVTSYTMELSALGVPSRDDTSWSHETNTRGYREVAGAIDREIHRIEGRMEASFEGSDHDLWSYLREWSELYHMVIVLRDHGLAAVLTGG